MGRKYRHKGKVRNFIPLLVLFIYFSFLIWRMFFFAYTGFYRAQSSAMEFNLIPFKTIINFIIGFESYDLNVWIYNLFGNIVVFLPLGFLLPLVLKRKNDIRHVAVISFFIIFIAESMQLILRVGVFDVDDIMLNLLGCSIGYIGYKLVRGLRRV